MPVSPAVAAALALTEVFEALGSTASASKKLSSYLEKITTWNIRIFIYLHTQLFFHTDELESYILFYSIGFEECNSYPETWYHIS